MSWTAPTTTNLSSYDVTSIVDALSGPDRDKALDFLDTVDDTAALYVVAREMTMWRNEKPQLDGTAADYRSFIRNL
jgi:hypothetical protein